MAFDVNAARAAIENGMGEAQELIKDPSKIDDLLVSLEAKLKEVPVAGEVLADIPLTIAMVKSYITKEYTDVSPKVIISLISAFVYLLKKKDIIPDNLPIVGQIDDIAVLGFALKFVEPELKAYAQWRDAKSAPAAEAPADSAQAPAAEAPADTPQAPESEAPADTEEIPAAEETVDPSEAPAAEEATDTAPAPEAPAPGEFAEA